MTAVSSRLKELVRLVASRALAFALRLRAAPLPHFERVLVITPHPDDETLGCGGTLARLAAKGTSIDVVALTDGSASHVGHPTTTPAMLSRIREQELREAVRILGVPMGHLHFLGIKDGTLDKLEPAEAERFCAKLVVFLADLNPDVVLAPMRRDGSSEHDHAATLLASVVGASQGKPRLLEYPVWARWHVRPLARELREGTRVFYSDIASERSIKADALAAHASQVRPLPPFSTPVLPPGFAALFSGSTELFFEY